MKNKSGFTLVELLSTLSILAIVLGIVSAAYIGITKHLKASYYKTLEESILVSGGEYYAYTSDRPEMFGDEKRVPLEDLVKNKYLTDITDRKGNQCDLALDKSYVGAYKDSYDKTNYYVCLTCSHDDYYNSGGKPECLGKIDYSLQMIAKVNGTNKIYQSSTWINSSVKLEFKTLNDIKTVYVKDINSEISCTIEDNNCSIIVDKIGKHDYEYYGVSSNGNRTKSGHIGIYIDTIVPTFDLYENTTNLSENKTISKKITSDSIIISNTVENIVDSESGVQSIRYSFEKQGASKKYIYIDNTSKEFNIAKDLYAGKYELEVEIKDYAGNVNTRIIDYEIKKEVNKPDSSYCNDLTFNGFEQILTKDPGEGYTFTNNTATRADNYEVTANLKENYVFDDGSTSTKFTCTIKRKATAIPGSCKDVTYDGSYQLLLNKDGSNVSYSKEQGKDAGIYNIIVTTNSDYSFSDGTTTSELKCTLKERELDSSISSCTNKIYNGKTGVTCKLNVATVISGDKVTASGTCNAKTKNVGTGKTVTCTEITLGGSSAKNYKLSSTSVSKISAVNITKKPLTWSTKPTVSNKTYDGTTAATITNHGAISGVESGDTATLVISGAKATFNNVNIGTGKPITFTGYKLTGTDAGNYSLAQPTGVTASITINAITVKAKNQSRTYNGSALNADKTCELTSGTLPNGYTLDCTSTGSQTNAGSSTKTLSKVKVMNGSTDVSANFTIIKENGTLIVGQATLTPTVTASNKTYDKNTNATCTVKLTGAANNESPTATATGSFANANVGTSKQVTCSNITLSSAWENNYELYVTSKTTTANITKRTLTTSISSCTNREYDGGTRVDCKLGVAEVISGDKVTASGTCNAKTKNVGTGKTVTCTDIALGGSSASNYILNSTSVSKISAVNITEKPLTWSTKPTVSNKTYDGTTAATITNHGTISGVESGDTATLVTSGAKATFNNVNIGTGKPITFTGYKLTGTDAGNYSLAQPTGVTGTISALSLTSVTIPTTSSHCKTNLVYNKTSQTLTETAGTGYTFSGNTGKNADDYTVTATLLNGYKWNDGTTGTKTFTCTISKAATTITLSSTSGSLYAGSTTTFDEQANVEGKFTNSSGDTSVATVSPTSNSTAISAKNPQTVTIEGKNVGSSTITVNFTPTDTTNYKSATAKTYTATVTAPVSLVGYKVRHYQMDNDGKNYTLVSTFYGEGKVGSSITGTVNSYDNFSSPSSETITLTSTPSNNVINYYYTRNCFGTTCDYCKVGSSLGNCLYSNASKVGLKSSGASNDTSNSNLRFIGNSSSVEKNYICFGNNTSCTTSNETLYRIIGVFGSSHETRIISTQMYGPNYFHNKGELESPDKFNYGKSKLYATVNSTASTILNSNEGLSTGTWANLLANRTVRSGYDKANKKTANDFYGIENSTTDSAGSIITHNIFPVSLSDLLLSISTSSNSYTFNANYSNVTQSWLFSGEIEWSFVICMSARSWTISKTGRLCSGHEDYDISSCDSSGTFTEKLTTYPDGDYKYRHYYRLNFQLNTSALFCGGSGTSSDPYKVGYNAC